VTVRPDIIDGTAVRVEHKKGCQTVGKNRFDDVETAVGAVTETLYRVLE